MAKPIFAFFDEYGEEGFGDKSSEWFILSAALQDAEDIALVRSCYTNFREAHKREENWHFHFTKCEHRMRLSFIRHMSECYVFMSVAVHKASITRTDNFQRPYFLYFYAAKLLLERISWMCRTQRLALAASFFSTRRGLNGDSVAKYLGHLRRSAGALANSIHWPSVEFAQVIVEPNKSRIGLQAADLMASSLGQALSLHPFGVNEPRYALELKDRVYRRNGSRLSYGLKFFPRLSPEMRAEERMAWLEEFES